MELFMYGDPRYLAGASGVTQHSRDSYENAPTLISGRGLTTTDIEKVCQIIPASTPGRITESMRALGQSIHKGKSGYHSTPAFNNFLVEGQNPTVGIELETISNKYSPEHTRAMLLELTSNWFHFERDGSLDEEHSGEYGFELITDPLPPRVYRNPNTWVQLENLLSPWLSSFDHNDTGLHVHVGVSQFQDFDAIPVENKDSRMFIGKAMSIFVYYMIADAALIDRICLRKPTRYCRTPTSMSLFDGASVLSSGHMTGYQFIDFTIGKLLRNCLSDWGAYAAHVLSNPTERARPKFCQNFLECSSGHNTELNMEHKYTLEFRRAKGTLHALSIHRIIELMTMIVRYAGKCCRNPEDIVSRKSFYDFICDNTTSTALKTLIKNEY